MANFRFWSVRNVSVILENKIFDQVLLLCSIDSECGGGFVVLFIRRHNR